MKNKIKAKVNGRGRYATSLPCVLRRLHMLAMIVNAYFYHEPTYTHCTLLCLSCHTSEKQRNIICSECTVCILRFASADRGDLSRWPASFSQSLHTSTLYYILRAASFYTMLTVGVGGGVRMHFLNETQTRSDLWWLYKWEYNTRGVCTICRMMSALAPRRQQK